MKLKKILNKKSLRYIFFLLTFIPLVTFFYINIPIWRVRAAATIVWDGGGDGTSWSDPLNWNTDAVPATEDIVLIETVNTVNISQPITVSGLTLGKAAVSTASVLNFTYDSQLAGSFTITGGDLTIYPGASITHTVASGSTVVGNVNINIQNGNANIYGNIDANAKGYTAGNGPGGVGYTAAGAGGASHTGYGGNSQSGAVGGTVIYGSYNQPTTLGSGGGNASSSTGGTGGGSIKLTVSGNVVIGGNITANGNSAANTTYSAGGGSGGSIWISCTSISGAGNITANGGNGGIGSSRIRDGGGGSGGRISINYTGSNDIAKTQFSAKGGDGVNTGSQRGGAGSIFLKASASSGELVFDNKTSFASNHFLWNAKTPVPSSLLVETLTITNYAHIVPTNTITTNSLNITGGGTYFNQNSTTVTYNTIDDWAGGIIVDNGGTFAIVSSGASLTIPVGSRL